MYILHSTELPWAQKGQGKMVSSLGLDFAVFNVARLLFFFVILMEQLVQNQMEGLQTGPPTANRFSWEINRISSFFDDPGSCQKRKKRHRIETIWIMNISSSNSLLCLATLLGLLEAGLLLFAKATTTKRKSPFEPKEPAKLSKKGLDSDSVPMSSLPTFEGATDGDMVGRNTFITPTPAEAHPVSVHSEIPINWGSYYRLVTKYQKGDRFKAISGHSISIRVISVSGLHYGFPEAEPEIVIRPDQENYTLKFSRMPAGDYDFFMIIRHNATDKPEKIPPHLVEQEAIRDYCKQHKLLQTLESEFVLPIRLRYRDINIKVWRDSIMAGGEMPFQLTQLVPSNALTFHGAEAGAHIYLVKMPKDGSDEITPSMTHRIGYFPFSSSPTRNKFAIKLPDHISGFHQIVVVQKFMYSPKLNPHPLGPDFPIDYPRQLGDRALLYVVIGRSTPFVVVSKTKNMSSLLVPTEPIPSMEDEYPFGFGKFSPYGTILARDSSLTPVDLTADTIKIRVNLHQEWHEMQQFKKAALGAYSPGASDRKDEGKLFMSVRAFLVLAGLIGRPVTQMANWYLHYPERSDSLPAKYKYKDGETRMKLSELANLGELPAISPEGILFSHVRKCSGVHGDSVTTPSSASSSSTSSVSSTDTLSNDVCPQEWAPVRFKESTHDGNFMVVESMKKLGPKGTIASLDFIPTTSLSLVYPRRLEVWMAGKDKVNDILLKVRNNKYFRQIILEVGLQNVLLESTSGSSLPFGVDDATKYIGGVCIPFYPLAASVLNFKQLTPAYTDKCLRLGATFESIEPASFSGLGVFTVRVTALECHLDSRSGTTKKVFEYSTTASSPRLVLSNTHRGSARNLTTPHILQDAHPCSRPNNIKGKSQSSTEGGPGSLNHRPLHSSEYICLSGNCHPNIKGLHLFLAKDAPKVFGPRILPYND